MPYANLSDDVLDRLEQDGLDRDAVLLYVEGLSFCSRLLTDGHIRIRLSKVSGSPDPDAAAARLVETGWWQRTDDGYFVVDYLAHHRPRTEVEKSQANARLKVKRSRLHKSGDHSLCIAGHYCPKGLVTGNETGKETLPSPLPSPPLRRKRKGKGGKSDDPDALARSGLSDEVEGGHAFADAMASGFCDGCGLPEGNRYHEVAS